MKENSFWCPLLMFHILFTAFWQLASCCKHGNKVPSFTNIRNLKTSWEASSFSRRPQPQSYGAVSQSVSYNTLRMLGPISLCLNFISQNFQEAFTETSVVSVADLMRNVSWMLFPGGMELGTQVKTGSWASHTHTQKSPSRLYWSFIVCN